MVTFLAVLLWDALETMTDWTRAMSNDPILSFINMEYALKTSGSLLLWRGRRIDWNGNIFLCCGSVTSKSSVTICTLSFISFLSLSLSYHHSRRIDVRVLLWRWARVLPRSWFSVDLRLVGDDCLNLLLVVLLFDDGEDGVVFELKDDLPPWLKLICLIDFARSLWRPPVTLLFGVWDWEEKTELERPRRETAATTLSLPGCDTPSFWNEVRRFITFTMS